MNVNPGGKQPIMHPGRLPNGQEQQMVDSRGVPKGLRQVLQERGVDTRIMKKDMVERLQQFDDFKYELNTVQRYLIKDLGHRCISLPKVSIQQICIYFSTMLHSSFCVFTQPTCVFTQPTCVTLTIEEDEATNNVQPEIFLKYFALCTC